MNAEELQILNRVVNKLCKRFVFGCYDIDDIKQEARIMGLEAFNNYDESKGTLYTFLYTHIKNRLFTLRRDKHFRVPPKDLHEDEDKYNKWMVRNLTKQNLSQPSYIEDIDYNADDGGKFVDCLWNKDMINHISDNLPIELLSDFRKIIDGYNISKAKFDSLVEKIKEILNA